MSDSCRKYVENELNLLKDRLENINNEIHSSNIELKTIDKNIKKLNKEKDWTEDTRASDRYTRDLKLLMPFVKVTRLSKS